MGRDVPISGDPPDEARTLGQEIWRRLGRPAGVIRRFTPAAARATRMAAGRPPLLAALQRRWSTGQQPTGRPAPPQPPTLGAARPGGLHSAALRDFVPVVQAQAQPASQLVATPPPPMPPESSSRQLVRAKPVLAAQQLQTAPARPGQPALATGRTAPPSAGDLQHDTAGPPPASVTVAPLVARNALRQSDRPTPEAGRKSVSARPISSGRSAGLAREADPDGVSARPALASRNQPVGSPTELGLEGVPARRVSAGRSAGAPTQRSPGPAVPFAPAPRASGHVHAASVGASEARSAAAARDADALAGSARMPMTLRPAAAARTAEARAVAPAVVAGTIQRNQAAESLAGGSDRASSEQPLPLAGIEAASTGGPGDAATQPLPRPPVIRPAAMTRSPAAGDQMPARTRRVVRPQARPAEAAGDLVAVRFGRAGRAGKAIPAATRAGPVAVQRDMAWPASDAGPAAPGLPGGAGPAPGAESVRRVTRLPASSATDFAAGQSLDLPLAPSAAASTRSGGGMGASGRTRQAGPTGVRRAVMPAPARPAGAPDPASAAVSPATAAGPESLDLERLAGEVYAIIERRLIVERESLGL